MGGGEQMGHTEAQSMPPPRGGGEGNHGGGRRWRKPCKTFHFAQVYVHPNSPGAIAFMECRPGPLYMPGQVSFRMNASPAPSRVARTAPGGGCGSHSTIYCYREEGLRDSDGAERGRDCGTASIICDVHSKWLHFLK